MLDNNFEKKVHDKMGELEFVPSDLVWENVEKEINKEKKRRFPFFWIFLFSGLLLLGGGYFFTKNKKHTEEGSIANSNTNAQNIKIDNAEKNENGNKENKVENNNIAISKGLHNDDISNTDKGIIEEKNKKNISPKWNLFAENKKESKKTNSRLSRNIYNQYVNKKNDLDEYQSLDDGETSSKTKKTIIENEPQNINENASPVAKALHSDSAVKKKSTDLKSIKEMAKDSIAEKKPTNAKKQSVKPSKWELRFNGGLGISNINKSFLKSTSVYPYSYGNNIVPYFVASPVSQSFAYQNPSSKIYPDFSFFAGAFIKKELTARAYFSIGLNYHYFSTKIYAGYMVDSIAYISVNRNILYNTNNGGPVPAISPTTIQVNNYYVQGTNTAYINHYHFIELPILLGYQLNKTAKTPLYLETGFSFSYLFSTDALHFDPTADLYYKDPNQFNRYQMEVQLALMMGIRFGKNKINIGPQIQYGLSNVLYKNIGNPEHLLYTGLKFSFVPKKK